MIQEHQSKLEEKEYEEIEAEAIVMAKTIQRKTRCVRMYPDTSQRKVLDGWFTDAQKVWNQALNTIYRAEYHVIRKDISFVPNQKRENKDAPNPQPLPVVRFLNLRRKRRKKDDKATFATNSNCPISNECRAIREIRFSARESCATLEGAQ